MDETEKIAREFLRSKGFTDLVYEPDGNVPPDFLANGEIAIEVRRLNQNFKYEEGYQGLENARFYIRKRISKHLNSYGPAKTGESWFVTYKFSRPIANWNKFEPQIEPLLLRFRVQGSQQESELNINDWFTINIWPASKVYPTFYVFGGFSDRDANGFVLSKIIDNLDICINEKTIKIQGFQDKYPFWWLVLVDHIDFSMDDTDREHFRNQLKIKHEWNKVILVDPTRPERSFEI